MPRELWIDGSLRTAIPDALVVASAVVTRLGDPFFLAVLLLIGYWLEDGEEQAAVIGLSLSGLAALVALKYTFALPRPTAMPAVEGVPSGLRWAYETAIEADGYGFPSGHATGATIVYTLLATTVDVGSRRTRYAVAASTIVLVALSRVFLGVHYLIDVIAGVVLGLVLVLLGRRLVARYEIDSGTTALGLAVILGGLATAISGWHRDGLLLLGAALGAFGGWQYVLLGRLVDGDVKRTGGTAPLGDSYRGSLAVAGIGPLFGALAFGVPFPDAAIAGVMGLVLAAAVALPAIRRVTGADSDRRPLSLWRRRFAAERRVLVDHLRRHDPVVRDRGVLRLAAMLYLLPALITIESFSEPIPLPSVVVDLLRVPFAVLVSRPVMFVKGLLYDPLGLEWLFDVAIVSNLVVLATLFFVYACVGVLVHNGRLLLSSLAKQDTLQDPVDEQGTGERVAEPVTSGNQLGDDSASTSEGRSK